MRSFVLTLVLIVSSLSALLQVCSAGQWLADNQDNKENLGKKWIIVLKDGQEGITRNQLEAIIGITNNKHNVKRTYVGEPINGFEVEMSANDAQKIARSPMVKFVKEVSLSPASTFREKEKQTNNAGENSLDQQKKHDAYFPINHLHFDDNENTSSNDNKQVNDEIKHGDRFLSYQKNPKTEPTIESILTSPNKKPTLESILTSSLTQHTDNNEHSSHQIMTKSTNKKTTNAPLILTNKSDNINENPSIQPNDNTLQQELERLYHDDDQSDDAQFTSTPSQGNSIVPTASLPSSLPSVSAQPSKSPSPTAIPSVVSTPACGDATFLLELLTDNYPSETTWKLKNECTNEEELGGGPYSNRAYLYTIEECVPLAQYTFTIFDSYGDGLCCGYGYGEYKVSFNGEVVAEGASFRYSESTTFGTCGPAPSSEPSVSAQPSKSPSPTATASAPPTFVPTWGLDRIDDRNLPLDSSFNPIPDNEGSGVTAYIVDTGIRISHVDFEGRASYGINTVNNNFNADDCNGHGTHVAGTVGGSQWGVAKSVDLVAVKVLDCGGSGSWSGVIAGLEWIKENAVGPSTVNMSLGGGRNSAIDLAVKSLVDAGIPVVVAAGNANSNACNYSPAGEPSAITVASTTDTDSRSSFSNYGDCIDIFAPGSVITSAYHTSDTASTDLSGTSMASPHVCGASALFLGVDSSLSPDDIVAMLSSRSTKDTISDVRGSVNELLYVGEVAPTAPPTSIPSSKPSVTPRPSVSPAPTANETLAPTNLVSSAIIDNGVIMLGVNNEGHLNVAGGEPDEHSPSLTVVGLRFFRDGGFYESISHGAQAEGFGVSYEHVSSGAEYWGGANADDGVFNLVPELLSTDGTRATTVAQATSLSIKHEYAPSPDTDNLYEVKITYTNTSPTESLKNLRYRRVVDWDIPPSVYSECVSIFFQSVPMSLEYTTDDGFENVNPLDDVSNSGINFSCPGGVGCPVYDNGPTDHGSLFQFLFVDNDGTAIELGPGESFSFDMFYGAAASKADAESALNVVGAEIVSYGYPPSGAGGCSADASGSPNVYILGFRGVGAIPVFGPAPSSEPSVSAQPSKSPSPTATPSSAPSIAGKDDVVFDNGYIKLGLMDKGLLFSSGNPMNDDFAFSSSTVGFSYNDDGYWVDAIAHEPHGVDGFGVSYEYVSTSLRFWGGVGSMYGVYNVQPVSLVADTSTATLSLHVHDLEVKFEYRPSAQHFNVYDVKVTFTNLHSRESFTNLRFRKVMDLGIPFSPSNECVSLFFEEEPSGLEYLSDDGFVTPSPLIDASCCGRSYSCVAGSECSVSNFGPYDAGTLFQFLLKDESKLPARLDPGESLSFEILYGAHMSKEAGMEAMVAVNAEIASFIFSPSEIDGSCTVYPDRPPMVFMVGFRGVGGVPLTGMQLPSDPSDPISSANLNMEAILTTISILSVSTTLLLML